MQYICCALWSGPVHSKLISIDIILFFLHIE